MTTSDAEPLLLDTHVWIWASEANTARVSARVVSLLNAAAREGRLLVSAVSVWELAVAVARGRVSLNEPIEVWVRRRSGPGGHRLVPLTPEDALESVLLPGSMHADPADRFLVATARRFGARLVTADGKILKYGLDNWVLTLDPGQL